MKKYIFSDLWVEPMQNGENCRLVYLGLNNFDADLFDYSASLRIFNTTIDATLAEEGVCAEYILMLNAEGIGLAHFAKCNISYIRNHIYYVQVHFETELILSII